MPSEYAKLQWNHVQEYWKGLEEDMTEDFCSFKCFCDADSLIRELKQLKAEME